MPLSVNRKTTFAESIRLRLVCALVFREKCPFSHVFARVALGEHVYERIHLSASVVANGFVVAVVGAVDVMARPCRFVCARTPNANPFSLIRWKRQQSNAMVFIAAFYLRFIPFFMRFESFFSIIYSFDQLSEDTRIKASNKAGKQQIDFPRVDVRRTRKFYF